MSSSSSNGVSPWQFQMLGNFLARRGESVITRYRAQQQRALLAYLVYHRGKPQSREHLAATFWPDAGLSGGRANLRTALSALRRQLEGPGLAPEGSVLVSDGNAAVTLSAEAAASDVAAFEGALRRAAAAGARGEAEAERAAYEDALAAWSGPLLPGFYEDWALAERNRLDEAYRRALLRLAETYRRAGERQRALVLARQAVVADPLDEDGHAMAIRLLREMDRDADARRQFRELEKVLAQEFGVAPSDRVRALLTADVVRAPKKPALAPQPPPEQAATNPDAPAPPPARESPPPTAPAAPVRLPRPLTRFHGREHEVEQIGALLLPRPDGAGAGDGRLVTLIGPGGSGKTRLAVEAARRMAEGHPAPFPGGVAFVPLADLRDPARLPEAVADALDAPRPPGAASAWDRIAAVLPAAGGAADTAAALVLLDNIEHLLPGAAGEVRTLLERFPAVHCLVTSRSALSLGAERELALEPLATPGEAAACDAGDDLDALRRAPAVALFLDRARAIRPDFALSARNAAAVAELCRALEGIPLAIELAAAWTQLLPPARILERVREGERFSLLVSRRRDVPARHATLHNAIASSYELLPERARALFARLAVFRGGWSLEDAEAVCGGDDPLAFLDDMTTLREHSLISAREAEGGGALLLRFRMLETLREFAAERLAEADPDEAASLRHAEHFLAVAEAARPALSGPDPLPALERMGREQENVRAAGDRLRREPRRAADVLRLALALAAFGQMRGSLAEARQQLDGALARAADAAAEVPPALRAQGFRVSNQLAQIMFDFEGAEADCREALELYRAAGDEVGRANILKDLARIALGRADADRARALLEEARPVLERAGDAESLGTLYNAFGMLAMNRNAAAEAEPHYVRALELLDGVANPQNVARVRANLGMVFAAGGNPAAAREQQELAARELRRAGDRWTLARVLDALGDSLTRAGSYDDARPVLDEALALHRELRDWQGALDSHYYLSQLLLEHEPGAAESHLRECLSIARFSPVARRVAYVLQACGDYAAARGRHGDAALLWAVARQRFESLGIRETGPLTYAQARYLPAVESALGPDARRALDARGRALTDDEALGAALPVE